MAPAAPLPSPRPGRTHTLLVAETARLRAGTVAWVERELTTGAKVLVKGWFGVGIDEGDEAGHWLAGPDGAPSASRALDRGQLELLGYPVVIERSGGTAAGLHRLQSEEVERAVEEGWPRVAMTQETALRPMTDPAEVTQLADQESSYDRLAARWPVTVLCQLSLTEERPAAVWASVVQHHRELVAASWSAHVLEGRWYLAGEVDVVDARELEAAVHGVVTAGPAALELDLGGVTFLDMACARALVRAVAAAEPRAPVVVHRVPVLVRELLELVGPPPALTFATDADRDR